MFRSLARTGRSSVIGMLMVTMTTVSFYMITAYTPTFGSDRAQARRTDSLIVTLCVGDPTCCGCR